MQINRFIYTRKFLKLPLSSNDFFAHLKGIKATEEEIARKHGRLSKHGKKWTNINNYIGL